MKKEYRNSARTKKMIREAFAELIGEKKMISNISVAELAERADIAKSTFYNHYEDLYAVADEMAKELIASLNELIDALEADKNADYHLYIKNVFSFLKSNEDIYRKLSISPDTLYFIEMIKSIISRRVFSDGSFFTHFKRKSDKYIQARFITHACVDTIVDYFRGEIEISFDEIEDSILNLIDKVM